jgi:PEP-CTERM motif
MTVTAGCANAIHSSKEEAMSIRAKTLCLIVFSCLVFLASPPLDADPILSQDIGTILVAVGPAWIPPSSGTTSMPALFGDLVIQGTGTLENFSLGNPIVFTPSSDVSSTYEIGSGPISLYVLTTSVPGTVLTSNSQVLSPAPQFVADVIATPEPGSLSLLGLGLIVIALVNRRLIRRSKVL